MRFTSVDNLGKIEKKCENNPHPQKGKVYNKFTFQNCKINAPFDFFLSCLYNKSIRLYKVRIIKQGRMLKL